MLALTLELIDSLLLLALGQGNALSAASDLPAALDILARLIAGIQKSGKRGGIRKNLYRIILIASRIIDRSNDLELTLASTVLLTRLCEDRMLEMSRSDVSLVLNAVAFLAAKHNPLNSSSKADSYLNIDDFFDAICRLLTAILSHRREPLVDSIPSFVGVLRGLMHCFRQDLGGIKASSATDSTSMFIKTPYSCFAKSRLKNPVAAAESLGRIFEKMGQKSSASASVQSASTGQASLQSATAATVRPFSKHAGFLVSEYVSIQASMSPLPAPVKSALIRGVYALLDLSGDFGRQAVLAGLDALQGMGSAAKLVFKELVADWDRHSFGRKAKD
ncbi:Urb2/Npa2 family-domain-containing protein [Chytriomyces sp. MP71]|nr:Urb2/Npa2 family-domain-containing protein [Chytriomyces sp. MP71]